MSFLLPPKAYNLVDGQMTCSFLVEGSVQNLVLWWPIDFLFIHWSMMFSPVKLLRQVSTAIGEAKGHAIIAIIILQFMFGYLNCCR